MANHFYMLLNPVTQGNTWNTFFASGLGERCSVLGKGVNREVELMLDKGQPFCCGVRSSCWDGSKDRTELRDSKDLT